MCHEWAEGGLNLGGRPKHLADHLRHHVGFDIVTAESGTYGRVTLLPSGEVGLGKLRTLAADGSVDGEHDTPIGLFEVQ